MRSLAILSLLCISAFCWAQDTDWLVFPAARNVHEGQKGSAASAFAVTHNVGCDMSECGSYQHLADGSFVWSVGLASESSVSINAFLTEVRLLVGDELTVSSPDGSFREVFTHADISRRGTFQSPIVPGRRMLISLSGHDASLSHLRISKVNVGFLDIDNHPSANTLKAGYGASQSCEVNASCDPAVDNLRYAVCRITANGSQYGTGTLINNTANDGTPYLLTAAHVFGTNLDNIESLILLFNFETMVCQNVQPNNATIAYSFADYDAQMVAFNETTDMALVRLSRTPDDRVSPYWAGWDRTAPQSGVCSSPSPFRIVHHPGGDVRKVSLVTADVVADSYYSDRTATGKAFDADAHWRVGPYASGATEGGSSGSALVDANGHALGVLTGGSSSCSNPGGDDYYSRLDYNWDALASYLDPLGTGRTTLDGRYFYTDRYVNLYNIAGQNNVVSSHLADNTGYLAGHNGYGATQFAQQLDTKGSEVEVTGLYIAPYTVRSSHANGFNIKVWSDKNGEPGDLVVSKRYSNAVLSSRSQTYLAFDKAARVSGKFFVGVEISYPSDGVDTLAFYYAPGGTSARFFSAGIWRRANNFCSEVDVDLFFGARCRVVGSASSVQASTAPSWRLVPGTDNHYSVDADVPVSVEVYNITGRCLVSLPQSIRPVVSLSSMASGIYIINVRSASDRKSFKVINR